MPSTTGRSLTALSRATSRGPTSLGWRDAAKLVVVDQLSHRRIGAADWALRIFSQLQRAEAHAECVDQQQTTDERLADAEDQLDGLGCLDDSDEAGQDAEYATLSAGGNQSWRWRFGVEAAVARAFLGAEDAGLAFEAEDGAIRIRFVQKNTGIVDQVAGLEVVCAVGDDVVVLEDLERVGAGEHSVVLHHLQVGVEALEHDLGRVDLEHPDGRRGVDDLSLEVAGIDGVEVDEADRTDACGREIKGKRRAQPAGAYTQNLRSLQLLLALHTDLWQNQVPRVARDLIVGQLGKYDLFYCSWHWLFPLPPGWQADKLLSITLLQRLQAEEV